MRETSLKQDKKWYKEERGEGENRERERKRKEKKEYKYIKQKWIGACIYIGGEGYRGMKE